MAFALLGSGCTPGALIFTHTERLREEQIATRTTSRPADVAGTECYVDKQLRITNKTHISSWWGAAGGFDAILFGLAAAGASASDQPWVLAVALDGAIAFAYFAIRNRHVSQTTRWEETLETASCHP